MHFERIDGWRHDHTFGTEVRTRGERRTWWVVGLTAAMMVAEIIAGMVYGSAALLADGWHMGTHAAALSVTIFAYVFARRHAGDRRYSFGTGKVGALGGFASAVGLAIVALFVLVQSAERLASPTHIRFDEAIGVACLGLAVNLACAVLLRDHDHGHGHGHGHGHRHQHQHGHEDGDGEGHEHGHGHDGDEEPGHDADHHDHNLRGAYLHVLADALTSVLAIAALSAGKFLGWNWMDPIMGIVGSLVIARWSLALLRDTSRVLLDAEFAETRQQDIHRVLESDADTRVTDLHVWRVGPRHLAAIVSLVTHDPREPAYYKNRLSRYRDLAHVTVEVHRCAEPGAVAP